MSDLIKQLRYAAQGELFGDTLLDEAADRIAELESLLKAQPKTIDTTNLNPCCPTCGADPTQQAILRKKVKELEAKANGDVIVFGRR